MNPAYVKRPYLAKDISLHGVGIGFNGALGQRVASARVENRYGHDKV